MERFDYQHLDGIAIEADDAAIRIDYSEPDQGGARLLIKFRIYLDGRRECISGYAHDQKLNTKDVERSKIPQRVLNDALNWISEQKSAASSNHAMLEILNRIELALNK